MANKIYIAKKEDLTSEVTRATDAENNLNERMDALAAKANVKVVATKPEVGEANTLYYVGTTSPYHIWLYTTQWYDFGTTEIDLSGYVKTSGDETISGIKTFASEIKSNYTQTISRTVDNEAVRINGGSGYEKGARLYLAGKDNSSYAGQFSLESNDGSNVRKLVGRPDGNLSWDGKTIATIGDIPTPTETSKLYRHVITLSYYNEATTESIYCNYVMLSNSAELVNKSNFLTKMLGKHFIATGGYSLNDVKGVITDTEWNEYTEEFTIKYVSNGSISGVGFDSSSEYTTISDITEELKGASSTKKYQHNICVSDSDNVFISFSFINTTKDAYTTNAAVSNAIYRLGFNAKTKNLCGSGSGSYTCVYGTTSGNFYYFKPSNTLWTNGNWGSVKDTVVEI